MVVCLFTVWQHLRWAAIPAKRQTFWVWLIFLWLWFNDQVLPFNEILFVFLIFFYRGLIFVSLFLLKIIIILLGNKYLCWILSVLKVATLLRLSLSWVMIISLILITCECHGHDFHPYRWFSLWGPRRQLRAASGNWWRSHWLPSHWLQLCFFLRKWRLLGLEW